MKNDPAWSRRVFEWGVVTLVLMALIWTVGREARVVQGQGERVAVRATLATLRTALAIDQLMPAVSMKGGTHTPMPKNPFTLVESVPSNYVGEQTLRNIYSVAPGSWVFDPERGCVGYRLLYPEGLDPEQEADAIWFRVGGIEQGPRLSPQAEYRWYGQSLT